MSVKVAVRVRPFNGRERELECTNVVEMVNTTTRMKSHQGDDQRDFTFDYSFWSFDDFEPQQDGYLKGKSSKYADQKDVYNALGKNILDNAWEGYHCCLFAYGQTGSGKSYSMIGYGENKGIVPITCNEMFKKIESDKKSGVSYEVNASMLEIYNQEVQDLTIIPQERKSGGLKIRQNKLLGVYVDGIKKHFVTSFKEIQNVMEEGTKNRTVAATQMNATSSRAHTIITIEFKQIEKIGDAKAEKISMINLVDLAGSERIDKTGAKGSRLKQAVGINQSLTSLGQVISALAENAEGKNNFIPYRNSALTRILQSALGGNSQTIMICAISPATDNYDETLSTLRYAERAKKIKNKPIVNESESDKLIKSLKSENQRLKKLLEERQGNPGKQVEPKKEEPQQNAEGQANDEDSDGDDEDIQAKLQAVLKAIKEEQKPREEKMKEGKEDQKNMMSANSLIGNLFMGDKLSSLRKNNEVTPAYFENISKDMLINRKFKILLDKPHLTVGKVNQKPRHYIELGGRDIEKLHAELTQENQDGQVRFKSIGYHNYVNGSLIARGQSVILKNFDVVVFGWNSPFLFKSAVNPKKKDESKSSQELRRQDSQIDWYYVRKLMIFQVDIDQSDNERQSGEGGCCSIF